MATKMTREEAVALLERYSNYEGMGIPNLAGCKEAMKVAVDALKEAFPELAESEDEWIRRWLCGYFSSIDKAWIHKDITCIDILRWLEKQKEQKKEKFPPYVTGFKGHPDPAGTSDLEEAAEKYIQGSMCDLDDGPSTGLAKESFIAGAKWQKEQKSAEWDKEDKEMFEAVDESLYCYESGKAPEAVAQIEAERCWLSSLPERFNLQPKQEWSEEEIIYWNTIKDYFFGIPFDDKLKSALDWFKSLKPSWKPSEQDIKMLEHIIGQYEIGNKNSKVMGYLPRIEELDFLKKVLAKWKN